MKKTLTEYFESLPARGGNAERLRQERILQSIDERVKFIRKRETAELKRLESRPSLSPEETRSLHYLQMRSRVSGYKCHNSS